MYKFLYLLPLSFFLMWIFPPINKYTKIFWDYATTIKKIFTRGANNCGGHCKSYRLYKKKKAPDKSGSGSFSFMAGDSGALNLMASWTELQGYFTSALPASGDDEINIRSQSTQKWLKKTKSMCCNYNLVNLVFQ